MTTLAQINQKARALLREGLDPVEFTRFLQQYEQGEGDYTAERQQREPVSFDEVQTRLAALRAEGRLPPASNGS